MGDDGTGRVDRTRRRVLRWMSLAVVGGGIALLSSRALLSTAVSRLGNGGDAVVSAPAVSPQRVGGSSAAPLRVKAVYFQMPQVVGTRQEYFGLQSPAYFSELVRNVEQRHHLLSGMLPTMLILIEGVPATPAAILNDGDEVDFVPALVGG